MKYIPNKRNRWKRKNANPRRPIHKKLLKQVMNINYNAQGELFVKNLLRNSYKQIEQQPNKVVSSTQNNKEKLEQKVRHQLKKGVKKINNRKKIGYQQTPQKEQLPQNTKNEIEQKAQRKKKSTKLLIKKSQIPKRQTKPTLSKTSTLSENTQPAQKKNVATERHGKKIGYQQTPQKEQLPQNTKNEIERTLSENTQPAQKKNVATERHEKAQRKKKSTKRLIKKSQVPKSQTKPTRSKTSALSENTQPAQKKNVAKERHAYIKVETSQRLNTLLTCLKAMQKDKMKLVVIVNYSSSVKFYEELLHHLDNKSNTLFLSKQTPGDEASFTMEKFQTSQSATLFCTPSIAAKLKIEGPHLLIQFDPPLKVEGYISRLNEVGRTKAGKTLIFLHPKEAGLVKELRSADISIIDYILRGVHPIDIEKKLDLVMKKFYGLYLSALNAYRDFLTSYKSMDSEFLKLSNLSIKEVGKSFGFQIPPFVNLEETREKWKREMDEKKERTKKRRTVKLEKVYVHIR